jgi:brefeldin A-resistance guanine nucleotide exchange factor 1
MLRERKMMKQKYKLAAEKFNKKPLKSDWIRFAIDLGIMEPSPTSGPVAMADGTTPAPAPPVVESVTGIDAAALAKFLRRTPGLGKTQIGEYISKGPAELHPFHALVLKEYVKTFDFSGENSSFDAALRMFLGEFRLPGESQCIDR